MKELKDLNSRAYCTTHSLSIFFNDFHFDYTKAFILAVFYGVVDSHPHCLFQTLEKSNYYYWCSFCLALALPPIYWGLLNDHESHCRISLCLMQATMSGHILISTMHSKMWMCGRPPTQWSACGSGLQQCHGCELTNGVWYAMVNWPIKRCSESDEEDWTNLFVCTRTCTEALP